MDDLWDELDDLILWGDVDLLAELDQLVIDDEELQRYWARRKVNAEKATRLRGRIQFVREFPVWDLIRLIEPDVFGDHHERFKVAKALIDKKLRIEWILWAMYHYWMFDVIVPGGKNYGNRYSKFRNLWDKYLRQTLRHAKSRAKKHRRERRERKRKRKSDAVLEILRDKASGKVKIKTVDAITQQESTSDLEGVYLNDPVTLYRTLADSVPDILGVGGDDIWQ